MDAKRHNREPGPVFDFGEGMSCDSKLKPSAYNFVSDFRVCPVCTRGHFSELSLCETCWLEIRRDLNPKTRLIAPDGFVLKTLFDWPSGKSGVFGHLIYKLKGGLYPDIWHWLACQFLLRLGCSCNPGPIVFVSAAPAYPGQTDHASLWAQSLASQLDPCGLIWDPLERLEKSAAQKHRNRLQRKAKRVRSLAVSIGGTIRRSKLVFCDDVYTTGETAKQSLKILHAEKTFGSRELWVLAYRAPPVSRISNRSF